MATTPFAKALRELREESDWSLAELGDVVGLSKDYLWRLEQGQHDPAWQTVCSLADAFSVPTDRFRGHKTQVS